MSAAMSLAPTPRRLDAVLFDIDGTLLNSDALHLAVFQDVLQEEGFNGGDQARLQSQSSSTRGSLYPDASLR